MSRFIKEKMIEQYVARLQGVSDLAVISTQGVDVQRMTSLRSRLRARGMRAMVVKNSLCKRALAAAGLERASALIDGPTTVVWGGEGIVALAKTLVEQAKDVTEIEIRGGYTAGRVLSKDDIGELSRLPGRTELIAMAVGRAIGQGARVAALATSAAGRLLGQVRERAKGAAAEEGEAKAEGPEAAPAAGA